MTGPGRAILFYGRHSLEGLSLGKGRDTAFTLTDAGTWVVKSAHLAANPLTIQEGWQVIAPAITECLIEHEDLDAHVLIQHPQAFRFYHGEESPWEECFEDVGIDHQAPHHKPLQGRHEWWQRNPRWVLPQPPSPSPDQGFKSNRSSVLTASSVSSQSDRSEGSQHSCHGRPLLGDQRPHEDQCTHL